VLYSVRERVAVITLNAEVSGHPLAGLDARGMKASG
jgi:hypothetical protein